MMREPAISNWSHLIHNQGHALLRRGGLMNLAAQWQFIPLWVALCYATVHWADVPWLLAVAQFNLFFALGLYLRYRLIEDTPTSRLGSGAQGYVELHGRAFLPEGEGYRGHPDLPVTVWLPGYVEDQPFVLDDGKGRCLLYPDAAEILTRPADNHLDWLYAIYPGQTLYVLGEMRTLAGDNGRLSHSVRVSELLARWKRRPEVLLEAYDRNGNGVLDPDEWEQVRRTAGQVAGADAQDERQRPGTHIIDRSATGGRLFLITNIPPDELAGRFRLAFLLHLFVWLGLMAWVQGYS